MTNQEQIRARAAQQVTDETLFKAKVRRDYDPGAQELIDAYEGAVGSTGPGANPASIAAVLSKVVAKHTRCLPGDALPAVPVVDILNLIKELK
jgi:hypothetical protein